MQKVVGSSPIIRSIESPALGGVFASKSGPAATDGSFCSRTAKRGGAPCLLLFD